MMMFSTPSPANCETRGTSEMRESGERMPCTWKSDETKPVVSSTRAICALTGVVDRVLRAAAHEQLVAPGLDVERDVAVHVAVAEGDVPERHGVLRILEEA